MDEPGTAPGECPVCAGAIEERERILCPRCETPHHSECYSYNQGCAIFGCNPKAPATPLAKKGAPIPARPPAVLLGAAALLGVLSSFLSFHFHKAPQQGTLVAPGTGSYNFTRLGGRPPSCTAPRVGCVAPDFTLKDVDGYEHSLRSHSRGHVAVLTFWLAGCPDCMPSLATGVTLSKKFKDSGVWFTDVAYMGHPEQTAEWVHEKGIRNLVLLDSEGSVVRTYGVGTYTCFVLDEDGVIRYRGPVNGAENSVRALLGESDRKR